MVVPDNAALNEVPRTQGLLSFVKSDNGLYLRTNSSWHLIAYQREVKTDILQLNIMMIITTAVT